MQNEHEHIAELERRAEVELQKLGIAEDLGWLIAALAAAVVYLKWGGWFFSVVVFFGSYYLVIYPYRRHESAAKDAYHKASGTGKYYTQPKNP